MERQEEGTVPPKFWGLRHGAVPGLDSWMNRGQRWLGLQSLIPIETNVRSLERGEARGDRHSLSFVSCF
jgi:hypothetical protein